jgi:serine phosphatase RsbU (regulator of sigma subunit)
MAAIACSVAAAAVPAVALAQGLPDPVPKPPVNVPDPTNLLPKPSNPTTPVNTQPSQPAGGGGVTVKDPTGTTNTGVTVGSGGANATTPAGNATVGGNGGAVGVTPSSSSGGSSGVGVGGKPGVSVTAGGDSATSNGQVSITAGDTNLAGGSGSARRPSGTVHVGDAQAAGDTAHGTIGGHNFAVGKGGATLDRNGVYIGGQGSGAGSLLGGGGVGLGPSGVVFTNKGGLGTGGGGVSVGPRGVQVGNGNGSSPGIGGLLPGAGTIRAGGVPVAPGSLGALPGLNLWAGNPAFTIGGSAGMIAGDSPNALRPGAMGAYRVLPDVLGRGLAGDGSLAVEGMNALPGEDFPAGVLGIDPERAAAMAAADGSGGALTPAALVAQQLPAAAGGSQLFTDIGDAINAVIAGLPDWSRPIILVLLALVLFFGLRAMRNGRRARRFRAHLAETQRLAEEHAQLAESLAVENLVYQRALVPALPDHVNGIAVSAQYRPADLRGAGGDFYDVFALDRNRVAIIVGDVSGHDRSAVDRANSIRHSLRTHLWDDHEPRMVLKKTGVALARDETLDGDFATAIVAVHDTAAGTLTYACAGHPAPVLVGAADHAPVSVCSSPALGWGIPTGRRQTTIVLGDADTVCFYTDGLIEARYDGGFLGRDGLQELVAGLGADGTASDLLRQVIDRAHEADDDLAALILRAGTPTAARGLRIEELEISDHDVRRRSPERFLAACGAPEDVIEQIDASMEAAVADTGRALLKVVFDPEGGAMEALLEPLGEPRGIAFDPRVLVGD